jgi:hypothetical protein
MGGYIPKCFRLRTMRFFDGACLRAKTTADLCDGRLLARRVHRAVQTLLIVGSGESRTHPAIDRRSERFFYPPLDYYVLERVPYTRNQRPQATSLNFQMGVTDDEGHQHNDVGTAIWRNGRWLSRETPATQTVVDTVASVDTCVAGGSQLPSRRWRWPRQGRFRAGRRSSAGSRAGPSIRMSVD